MNSTAQEKYIVPCQSQSADTSPITLGYNNIILRLYNAYLQSRKQMTFQPPREKCLPHCDDTSTILESSIPLKKFKNALNSLRRR